MRNLHSRKCNSAFNPVLSVFPNAVSLNNYCPGVVVSSDSSEYSQFCESVYIVPTDSSVLCSPHSSNKAAVDSAASYKDIIGDFVAHCIRSHPGSFQSAREQNILTLGYRRKRMHSVSGMRNNADIECFAVNTIHLLFSSDHWKMIISRLGESTMRCLLALPMFMPTDNGSYVQVSGVAVPQLVGMLSGNSHATAQCHSPSVPQLPPVSADDVDLELDGIRRELIHQVKSMSSLPVPRNAMLYGGKPRYQNQVKNNFYEKPCVLPCCGPSFCESNMNSTEHEHVGMDCIFKHPVLSQKTISSLAVYKHIFLRNSMCAASKDVGTNNAYISLCEAMQQLLSRCVPSAKQTSVLKVLQSPVLLLPEWLSAHSQAQVSSLLTLSSAVLSCYKKCNIALLFSIHCVNSNTTWCNANMSGAKEASSAKKSRRRGCRGGAHVKKRLRCTGDSNTNAPEAGLMSMRSHAILSESSIELTAVGVGSDSQEPDYAGLGCGISKERDRETAPSTILFESGSSSGSSINNNAVGADNSDGPGLTTVGERLFRRVVRNITLEKRCFKRGYVSQEDNILQNESGSGCASSAKRPKLIDAMKMPVGGHVHNVLRRIQITNGTPVGAMETLESQTPASEIFALSGTALTPYYKTSSETTSMCTSSQSYSKGSAIKSVDSGSHTNMTMGPTQNSSNPPSSSCTDADISLSRPPSSFKSKNIHEISCPVRNVCAFVISVCRNVLPRHVVWGSRANENRFFSFVKSYILLGRYENKKLQYLMDKITQSEVPWLLSVKGAKNKARKVAGISHERSREYWKKYEEVIHLYNTNVCYMFLHWVFSSLINPMLATMFYITEGEGGMVGSGSGALLFYRKAVWVEITRTVGFNTINNNFVEIVVPNGEPVKAVGCDNSSALINNRNAKVSEIVNKYGNNLSELNAHTLPVVRFVPKPNSLRTITNMKYNTSAARGTSHANNGHNGGKAGGSSSVYPWGTVGGGTVTTNGALYNYYHLLKHVVDQSGANFFAPRTANWSKVVNPRLIPQYSKLKGFGCLGIDEAYSKFKSFKQHILRHHLNTVRQDGSSEETNTDVNSAAYPPFYMAVLDLEKCYDTIDTICLFDIIRKELIGDEEDDCMGMEHDGADMLLRYTLTQYLQSMERPITKRFRYVVNSGDLMPFPRIAKALARKYRNSLITDGTSPCSIFLYAYVSSNVLLLNVHSVLIDRYIGVIYPTLRKTELLKLISNHLFSHIVRLPTYCIKSKLEHNGTSDPDECTSTTPAFTQIRGIPQGSILSPLLCHIYYNNVENRVFGEVEQLLQLGLTVDTPIPSRAANTANPQKVAVLGKTCIIRVVDDYLVMSTDRQCVQYFLQKVHTNYSSFGGGVNPLKTRVNFDCDIEVNGEKVRLNNVATDLMPAKDALLSWCGYYINCRTLEVSPNFSRILDIPPENSITVEYNKQVGLLLRRAIKVYVKSKCHAIVLDSTINTLKTVESSVHEIFRVAAIRGGCYLRMLAKVKHSSNHHYIVHCINEAILFGARLLHTRTASQNLLMISRGEAACSPISTLLNENSAIKNVKFNNISKNSRGICLVSVNEAVQIGMKAFIDVFTLINCSGMLTPIIKILRSRLWSHTKTKH